jgi:trimeric autotransporter adhesin
MSNKTFFKRIALTAIAALGFGMLSVAPSNAAIVGNTLSIDAATDAVTVGESATAVLTNSFYANTAKDSVTIRAVLTSGSAGNAGSIRLAVSESSTSSEAVLPKYLTVGVPGTTDGALGEITKKLTVDSIDRISVSTKTADASSALRPDSFTIAPNGANLSVRSKVSVTNYAPQKAGTYTWTFYMEETNSSGVMSNSAAIATWTVTVTNRSTLATGASTFTLRQGSGTAVGSFTTDSQTLGTTTTKTTAKFTLWTDLNNTAGVDDADNAADSVTVVATGNAYVCTSSTYCEDRAVTIAAGSSAVATYIFSTGTAGTASVVVTALTAGLSSTKSLTFYGDGSKIAVGTSVYKIARAGGFTTSGMFTVTLKDSGDRAVPGKTLEVESSDATVVASGSCVDLSAGVTDGTYACSVTTDSRSTSGQSATLTITYTDALLAEYSTTYAVTLGGSVKTVVLTTDKAAYEPGEKMVITATAKDSSGNPVYDGATGPSLSANKALGAAISMNVYVGGTSTSQTRSSTTGLVTTADTLWAPAASGKFLISGVDGDALPISVAGTVSDDAATAAANAASDAAAEAIDAANAATDAANLAAEAADAATVAAEEARDAADAATAAVEELATQVATLMAALKAQITTLANTVAKIAKKVKA